MVSAKQNILLALAFFYCLMSFGQHEDIKFQHYYADHGLAHNYVLSIAQDDLGFMWFGTEDGLCRFDGIDFNTFRNIPGDPNSMPDNIIRAITFDNNGSMWLGGEDVFKFNIKTEQFSSLSSMISDTKNLSSGSIYKIIVDHTGLIWIIARPEIKTTRLFRFDIDNDIAITVEHDHRDTFSIASDTVHDIINNKKDIWIATNKSLEKYSHKINGFIEYPRKKDNREKIINGETRQLCTDPKGGIWFIKQKQYLYQDDLHYITRLYYLRITTEEEILQEYSLPQIKVPVNNLIIDYRDRLWISTIRQGLFLFTPGAKTLQRFIYSPSDQYSISNNDIKDLYIDRTNVLWIATLNGLNKVDLYKKPFSNYTPNPAKPQSSLSSPLVNAIYKDESNTVWVGTQDAGITKIHRYKNKPDDYSFLKNQEDRPHILVGNFITFINGDSDHNIWFGGTGINKLNKQTGQFSYFHPSPDNPYTIEGWTFWDMDIGPSGNKWFAGIYSVCKSLNKKDKDYKAGETRFMPLKNIKWNRYWAIHEDSNQILWIGSGGGLIKYDAKIQSATHIPFNTDTTVTGTIKYIHEDTKNHLWLATEGGGLHKFNKKTENFISFYQRDGLPSNTLWGILEDNENNLWISTNNGLSKFNPTTKKFKNFHKSDGLQDNIFRRGACYKSDDGELFFGGANGVTSFYPDLIHDNPYLPQVVITKLFLANQPVDIKQVYKKDTILKHAIAYTENITLHHTNKDFTIEFAALHFAAPEDNEYEYILEGYDETWNKTDSKRRYATYTNMPSGDYTFKVKAANNDEVWNHMGATIHIHITPPFYKKSWFYMLVAGIIIIVLVLIIKSREKALKKEMKFLRTLMDNIPDTIFFKNRECRYTIINKAQAMLLGVKNPRKIKGKTDFNFFDKKNAEKRYNEEKELIKTGKAIFNKTEEITIDKKTKRWVSTSKIPIINSSGNITGLLGISRDITKMKLNEIELKAAKEKAEESDRLKSAFLSNMSHEIRTPMNAIIGFSNLLSDEYLTKKERDRYLQYIQNSGHSLLTLINDIIDVAKIESNQLEIKHDIFDLHIILEELFTYYKQQIKDQEKEIKFTLEKPNKDKSFFIYTDPQRIKQVLSNLLSNAIKFTEKGYIKFGYQTETNKLLFYVTDSGIGIEKDKQKLIFERFSHFEERFKKNISGTGLGLSISRSIITLMEGEIWVDSQPGKGASFYFKIPYKANQML